MALEAEEAVGAREVGERPVEHAVGGGHRPFVPVRGPGERVALEQIGLCLLSGYTLGWAFELGGLAARDGSAASSGVYCLADEPSCEVDLDGVEDGAVRCDDGYAFVADELGGL